MEFTVESVLAQSPDDASTKAARKLVAPGKWPMLGYDSVAVWGECQGSGSKPYQVQVDLSGPSFKCSCPSRKFPCKHGLALMLLRVQHEASFKKDSEQPAWLKEWLASRQERAAKQEQKKEQASEQKAADPAAVAKREAARTKRMLAGLDELERWLGDRVRYGLAQLPGQNHIWQEQAARMVDAQLPGMAARLRNMGDLVGAQKEWPVQLLGQLGQLQLLIDAFRRIDTLPIAEQMDVRTALGLPIDKDEVLRIGERVDDHWQVLGQSFTEEGKLWRRCVWLRGQSDGRLALLLDFSHGSRRFEQGFINGSVVKMPLVFYPSAAPTRALIIDTPVLVEAQLLPVISLPEALNTLAKTVATHPWQWPLPMIVSDMLICQIDEKWVLHNREGETLPLEVTTEEGWQLLAISGGQGLSLMGEWDGQRLLALSAWAGVKDEKAGKQVLWSQGGRV